MNSPGRQQLCKRGQVIKREGKVVSESTWELSEDGYALKMSSSHFSTAAEVETGFDLAGLAAADYASGKYQRGSNIKAQAQTAYDEALKQVRQAESRGWALANVRERLRALADRLAGLGGNR